MKKIGLGVIIFGVILASIAALAETALIIRLGIRMFSVLSILPYFASIVGVIILIAGFAPAIKARLAAKSEIKQEEKEREARSRPTLSYTADFYDPADIRRRLADLKKRRPDLIGVLEKCEAQMDAMDRRQAKLKDLLDLNEAEYLRATENLLDEVEQFICKNFRKVINRGIVSDPEDDRVFSRDEKYSTHAELIEAALADNQTELDNIKKFLADLSDLVSEQNDHGETTLQAWMKVIRDSLKKEGI